MVASGQEAADCPVRVANALSGDLVCSLTCSTSTSVQQIKRLIAADQGTSHCCQSLFFRLSDRPLDASTTLASLLENQEGDPPAKPLTLLLVRQPWKTADHQASEDLILAAQRGHAETVKEMLGSFVSPDVKSDGGQTPLYMACVRTDVDVARLLVEAGADTNFRAPHHGDTCLLVVSYNGHLELTRMLVEAGADLDLAATEGWTPLHFAAKRGHVEVVRLLLEAGADIHKMLDDGFTALHFAAMKGHNEIVRLLLDAGMATQQLLDYATQHGHTALDFASRYEHRETVRMLLAAGADPERMTLEAQTIFKRRRLGRTPLSVVLGGWWRQGLAIMRRQRATPVTPFA